MFAYSTIYITFFSTSILLFTQPLKCTNTDVAICFDWAVSVKRWQWSFLPMLLFILEAKRARSNWFAIYLRLKIAFAIVRGGGSELSVYMIQWCIYWTTLLLNVFQSIKWNLHSTIYCRLNYSIVWIIQIVGFKHYPKFPIWARLEPIYDRKLIMTILWQILI